MRFVLAAGFVVLLAGAAHAQPLALRRVMLSSAGVGYFEYGAQTQGPATFGLDVPLAQVDDVLKSLVVFDAAGGVGGVELPAEDAEHAAFADVPFGPKALHSALDFLNSLQGVELQVTGPRPMTGALLRAERVQESVETPRGTIARTRVTLLTPTGLQQFVLEDAESVQVADPDLRGRIARALAALRGAAAHEARHLTLRMAGSGTRAVRVGYVAAVPLWKATYRLVLPAAEGDKARLQAWAVLENTSATDWDGVQLSLQYGNPVTFRQALYRSYYVQRPEVPVEVLNRILPDVDTRQVPPAPMAAAAMPRAMMMGAAKAEAMAPPAEAAAATEAAESTLFALPSPVALAAGHSATLPILDDMVPAERVGVVQLDRPHPLAALRIVNDSGASLPAGVLTLYDPLEAATFAGDARLGGLPAGESRLLEFAEDLRTSVHWQVEDATTLVGVTAAQGVLHVQRRARWTARVALTAPAKEARHLLVEIPRQPGGTLVLEGDVKASGETDAAWRVPVDLKAGEQRTLVAHVDRALSEDVALLQNDAVLAAVLNEQALTPATRTALSHIADLRKALAGHMAEQQRLKAQAAEVEHDEDRLRKNLAAVPAADALHAQLLRALAADEQLLADISAARAKADEAVADARTALEQAVTALRLD